MEKRIQQLQEDINVYKETIEECEKWFLSHFRPATFIKFPDSEQVREFARSSAEWESVRMTLVFNEQCLGDAEEELEKLLNPDLWQGFETLPVMKGDEFISDYI